MATAIDPRIRKLLKKADDMIEYTTRNLEEVHAFCYRAEFELAASKAERAGKYRLN